MTASSSAEDPVRFEIAFPEQPKRFMILVRWLLAIPHFLIVSILTDLVTLFALFAFFTILFTRRYPEGLFRLAVGFQRWSYNALAYVLFHDRYPPFSIEDGEYPPVSFDVRHRAQHNRWLPLVKWLLAIPHVIIVLLLAFFGIFVVLYMLVAVLITGRYPPGAFDFLVGVGRWNARLDAYIYLMVDEYPPFSMR